MKDLLLKLRDRWSPFFSRYVWILMVAATLVLSSGQTACAKKAKVPAASTGPIRVVLLPFSVPANKPELQWTAMGAPALLAKASQQMPDVTVTPLWEMMPSAIASAGASRSFNDESARALANWVGAKWAIMGDISATKSGYSLIVDFIPAKNTDVPFRYIKTRRMETMGLAFQTALRQWFRYVTARPVPRSKNRLEGLHKMQSLAEALDREYGWFAEANPGASQEAVEDLAATNKELVKILFSPTMYPAIAQ